MNPLDVTTCENTGRILTEWFEYPEYTEEEEYAQACEHVGKTPEEVKAFFATMGPAHLHEQPEWQRKLSAFLQSRRRRQWRNNMTQQEVAVRMNEATKLISPDNMKMLDEEAQKRTGLEINPLWMMECLVRSGVLNAKEQITALKELAQYTHSKAPTLNQNTNLNVKPEDWLLELAKEEYKVIDETGNMPTKVESNPKGTGNTFARDMAIKRASGANMILHAESELKDIEAEWGDLSAEFKEIE